MVMTGPPVGASLTRRGKPMSHRNMEIGTVASVVAVAREGVVRSHIGFGRVATEHHGGSGRYMNEQQREQAFLSAVTTEHFVTQAARGAIVGEMTGRAMLYMGAVSSALIAFGFVAPSHDVTPFVAS